MIEYRRDAIDDARLRSALSDCAGTIIYSRRRKVFLEAHRVAAASRRVSYRVVADLGYCDGLLRSLQRRFAENEYARS